MTDAEFLAWLKDDSAVRETLIEVEVLSGGVEMTRYLSMRGYVTSPTDTPPNQRYANIISTGIQYTEQLPLNGQAGLSVGTIEIHNHGGARDSWADDVWMNRRVRAWVGDSRWPRAQFREVFNGVASDLVMKDRNTLSLSISDKLQRLNTPVTDVKLGGTSTSADTLRPLAMGEVHNVTPLLVDQAAREFQVHAGPMQRLIEVRANGNPVTVTPDLATGKFVVAVDNASAVITASVQGDNAGGYRNTVAALVQRLVTGYGKASTRFTADDLDAANLAAFESTHPQPVGISLTDRTNVLDACQMLTNSLGAQIAMSRLGKLRLFQIGQPPAGMPIEIGPQHMRERSLEPTGRGEIGASVKLAFCRNWTVQSNLQTALPPEHIALFAQQWLTTTQENSTLKAQYRLDAEPVQEDTMLLRQVDAVAEAQRRRALRAVPRQTYTFDGTPEMLMLQLGAEVRVTANRFGMAGGVRAQIVSLVPDWMNCRVKVGFLVLPPAPPAVAFVAPGQIANDRDVLLQAAPVRNLAPAAGAALIMAPDAYVFHVNGAGIGTPSVINFKAQLVSLKADVTYTCSAGGTLTGTGLTRQLKFTDMTVDKVVVTASANYNGVPFEWPVTISKVYDGSNGTPGTPGVSGKSSRLYFTLIDGFDLAYNPTSVNIAGDNPPAVGTWGETRAWKTAIDSAPGAGQAWFQTSGVYDPLANQTVLTTPYRSTLRVGELSALAVLTGALKFSDTCQSENGNVQIKADGTIRLRSAAEGARMEFTSSVLKCIGANGVVTVQIGDLDE